MEEKSPKYLVVSVVIILIFTICIGYIATKPSSGKNKKENEPNRNITLIPEAAVRSLPNQYKYDDTHWIIPLESNASGSIYSRSAKIRGDVLEWKNDKVTIDTKGERVTIQVPDPMLVICVPDELDTATLTLFYRTRYKDMADFRKTFPDVVLELSKSSLEETKKIASPKDNIVVVSSVGTRDQMTAVNIAMSNKMCNKE